MMDALLSAIRENPLSYLPEVSLVAFQHFRAGYLARSAMGGAPHDWQFDRQEFWDWLRIRFQLQGADALNDVSIVSSFAANDVDAFYAYFVLLDEFLRLTPARKQTTSGALETRSFADIMRALRERPALYIGGPSFRACYSYLMGDERAHRDLQLTSDDGRRVFEDFKSWVEKEKNRALPRPWFKVISFWSMGVDCGHTEGGAFSVLFKWLAEYTTKIGRPELFRVPYRVAE